MKTSFLDSSQTITADFIIQLQDFLSRAMCATYAGEGKPVAPYRSEFIELEFQENDWHYRDSYAGYAQSWGQEVIWYKQKPLWTQIYGGGMKDLKNVTKAFCEETFTFLKQALSQKHTHFQPRGPILFQQENWLYKCEWQGDITQFSGHEEIYYQSNLIFIHDFRGCFFVE